MAKKIQYETPDQPRQVRLDTITSCNAKCLSCHRFISGRKGEMHLDFVTEILEDIGTWPKPLEEIVPVNYGEIFLHPSYAAILQAISQTLPQTAIVLPTNGMLMDVDLLASLPTLHIVNVSINAGFEDTYEQFMGFKADWPLLRTKIKKLKMLRPNLNVWTSMVFDPMYHSDLERDEFIREWDDISFPQVIPAASANRPEKTPQILRTRPCRSIFNDLVVGFDGRLSSCCFDSDFQMQLGEYSGDLLKDWKNSELEMLRRIHNNGLRQEVAWCKGCTFE